MWLLQAKYQLCLIVLTENLERQIQEPPLFTSLCKRSTEEAASSCQDTPACVLQAKIVQQPGKSQCHALLLATIQSCWSGSSSAKECVKLTRTCNS